MKFLWFVLAGVCGGMLAGMGMGGGTLTIPILVLLLSAEQLTAQFANLVAFLPTGAAALGMHAKNGLIKAKPLPYILIPALLTTAAASFFAKDCGDLIGKLYGGFLVIIAVSGLVSGALPARAGRR